MDMRFLEVKASGYIYGWRQKLGGRLLEHRNQESITSLNTTPVLFEATIDVSQVIAKVINSQEAQLQALHSDLIQKIQTQIQLIQ